MKTTDKIAWKKVIRQYCGHPPEEVAVIEDPNVAGVYAIRATFYGETATYGCQWHQYFLLNTNEMGDGPNNGRYADYLEEVEFTSWPPVSGQPKFFV